MIANIGDFAAAAVHPSRVTPAESTLEHTHKFLNTLGVKPGLDFQAS